MPVEIITEGEYETYKIPEAELREKFGMKPDPIVGMLWAGIPEDGKVNPYLLVTLQRTIVEAAS